VAAVFRRPSGTGRCRRQYAPSGPRRPAETRLTYIVSLRSPLCLYLDPRGKEFSFVGRLRRPRSHAVRR
jgi:hypothetical protein